MDTEVLCPRAAREEPGSSGSSLRPNLGLHCGLRPLQLGGGFAHAPQSAEASVHWVNCPWKRDKRLFNLPSHMWHSGIWLFTALRFAVVDHGCTHLLVERNMYLFRGILHLGLPVPL